MGSFQAKIGWKRPRKRENKNYRSIPLRCIPLRSYPTDKRKPQKNSKKFKKLKRSAMASFQENIGRKRPGKRENKNYRSVLLLPGA